MPLPERDGVDSERAARCQSESRTPSPPLSKSIPGPARPASRRRRDPRALASARRGRSYRAGSLLEACGPSRVTPKLRDVEVGPETQESGGDSGTEMVLV